MEDKKNEYLVILDGGEGVETTISATNDREAIQRAIDLAAEGDWSFRSGDNEETSIDVGVTIYHDGRLIFDQDVQIDPWEPSCTSRHGHDWGEPVAESQWLDKTCEICGIVRRKHHDGKISYIFPDA